MAESNESTPSSNMILKEARIEFEDVNTTSVVYPLDSPELIEAAKNKPFTLKEGCHYKITIVFKVEGENVLGLTSEIFAFRRNVRVAKDKYTPGSFAVQALPHSVTFPRHGWDEAPSGLLSRGSYVRKQTFTDENSVVKAELELAFNIKTEWDS